MEESQRIPRFTRYLRGFTDLETANNSKETSTNLPFNHSLGWLKLIEIVEKRDLLNDAVSTILQTFKKTFSSLEVSDEIEDPELYLIYMISNNEQSIKKLQALLKPHFPNISQKQIKELNKSVQDFMSTINSKCRRDVKKLLNFDKAVTPEIKSPVNVPKKLVSWNQPDLSFLTELNQESYVDSFSMIPQVSRPKAIIKEMLEEETRKEIQWLVDTLNLNCLSLFSSPDFTLADCICYIIGTLNSYRNSNDVSRLRQSLLDLLGNYECLAEQIIKKRHLLISDEIVSAVQTYITERRVSDAKYHYKNAQVPNPEEESKGFHLIPNLKETKYVKIKQTNGDPHFSDSLCTNPSNVTMETPGDYVVTTNSRLKPLQVQNKFELLTLNDINEENEAKRKEEELKIKQRDLKQPINYLPKPKKQTPIQNGVQEKRSNSVTADEFTAFGELIATFMRNNCTTPSEVDHFKARVGEIIMESLSKK